MPSGKTSQATRTRRPSRTETQKVSTLFKGLDMGTSRIIMAEMDGDKPVFSRQLNAFVSLPFSRMLQNTLEQEGILHTLEDDEILAFGNRADEFANLLGGATRRPMNTGLLNPREPRNLQMIELALENLCGPAEDGEKICYSIPSAPPGMEAELTYHEEALREVLENLGYQAASVNEGLAVVFAELKDSDFTGIGLSFGGGLCNVCVAFLGMPVLNVCTTHAGDYIDEKAAAVIGDTPQTLRLHKESDDFSLEGRPGNHMDRSLGIYYRDVVKTVVDVLESELNSTKRLPRLVRPIPVVFSGGTASVRGFHDILEPAIREARLPVDISEVRQARAGFNTTAKGSLLAAMLNM